MTIITIYRLFDRGR